MLLGNGNGTFQAKQAFGTGGSPESVAVADFNGDGKSDLVTADQGSNKASVLLGNGNGTFQARQSFDVGAQPCSVAVADFNGDGKSDLVTADNDRRHRERAARQRRRYVSGQAVLQHRSVLCVAVADFNGDGKSDLVTADQNSNKASVLLGNGNGTFQAKQSFATGSQPRSVAVADFNGDGVKDLVTADAWATQRACCSAMERRLRDD